MPNMDSRIAAVHRAVELQEKCRATYISSGTVIVRDEGYEEVARQVETFSLHDHPCGARTAFAWERLRNITRDEVPHYTVVLSQPYADSPYKALKKALDDFVRSRF